MPNFGKPCRVCDECYLSVTGTIGPGVSRRVAKSTDDTTQVSKAKQNLAKVATRKFRESKYPAANTNTLFNATSYSSLVPSAGNASSAPNTLTTPSTQPKKINLQDIFKSPIIQQNAGEEEKQKPLAKSEPTKTLDSSPDASPNPVIAEVLANRPKPPSRPGTPNGSRIETPTDSPKPGSALRVVGSVKSESTEYVKPKPPPRNISKQNLFVSENDEEALLNSLNSYPTAPASPLAAENGSSAPNNSPPGCTKPSVPPRKQAKYVSVSYFIYSCSIQKSSSIFFNLILY